MGAAVPPARQRSCPKANGSIGYVVSNDDRLRSGNGGGRRGSGRVAGGGAGRPIRERPPAGGDAGGSLDSPADLPHLPALLHAGAHASHLPAVPALLHAVDDLPASGPPALLPSLPARQSLVPSVLHPRGLSHGPPAAALLPDLSAVPGGARSLPGLPAVSPLLRAPDLGELGATDGRRAGPPSHTGRRPVRFGAIFRVLNEILA